MKKIIFFCITLLSFSFSAYPQEYEIKVKINGVSDTVVYLGHHYGDKKYVVDTTRIDSKGVAIFSGDKELNKGIYLVVMPSMNMTYFEILISDNKKFSIETDTTNYVTNMKVKACKENELFNVYQRKMADLQLERTELQSKLEEAGEDEEKTKEIQDQITKFNKDRVAYIDKLIKENPNLFFTKILLALKEIEIPDAPTDENGEIIDPDFQYKFYKKHYFDNLDFAERGLIRTPLLESKINYYFEKMVVPIPDSLIKEANILITKAYEAGDSLMYRYMASHLLRYFETSKIMGFDAVFVNIAENWYLNGKAYWTDDEFLEKLRERVVKISPNLIGNIAPNLMRMQTSDEKFISLHLLKADYTVLVFWEPECGHCKKLVPKLLQEYNDTLKDLNVNVVTVYTQYDKEDWKKFLDEKELYAEGWYNTWDGPRPHSNFRNLYDIYSTPVLYVLADDKRIVAKRVNVEDIKKIIEIDKKRLENEKEKNQ